MNFVKNKAKNISSNLLLTSILLFGLFPLIPEKIKGLPVVYIFIISLIIFIRTKKKKFDKTLFLQLSAIFFINFSSIFYTSSFVFPINKIETSLSLIILPLSFAILPDNVLSLRKINRDLFCNLFILSSLVLTFLLLIHFYSLGFFSGSDLKVNSFRKASQEIIFFGGHPVYLNLYFAVSILFLFEKISKESVFSKKILFFIIAIVLTINIILLSAKGVIISLLASSICYLFMKIKKRRKGLLISLVLILATLFIISFSPTVERRFRELTKTTTYTEFHHQNSTSIRIGIYKCVIKTIKKSPIIGFGWGESNQKLINCYKDNNNFLFKGRYNSHNQYLSFILNGGIIALFLFFLFLKKILKDSVNNKDYIFTSIIVLFITLFFTENILERQSGVILFIFIMSFFKLTNNKKLIDI